jgi:hypothetical protein
VRLISMKFDHLRLNSVPSGICGDCWSCDANVNSPIWPRKPCRTARLSRSGCSASPARRACHCPLRSAIRSSRRAIAGKDSFLKLRPASTNPNRSFTCSRCMTTSSTLRCLSSRRLSKVVLNQSLSALRLLSEAASSGLIGSSTKMKSAPRPVNVPPTEVANLNPPWDVVSSFSAVLVSVGETEVPHQDSWIPYFPQIVRQGDAAARGGAAAPACPPRSGCAPSASRNPISRDALARDDPPSESLIGSARERRRTDR